MTCHVCGDRGWRKPFVIREPSVPKVCRFMYLHIPTSCGLDKLSSVRSSLKILHTLMTSSLVGESPVALTFLKKSVNSSFLVLTAETGRPLSRSVFLRKEDTCLRVARRSAALLSFDFWPSYVDGRRFGKSLSATGSSNSAKGTITKTEKGTSRPRS